MARSRDPNGPQDPAERDELLDPAERVHAAAPAVVRLATGTGPPEGAVPRLLAHLCSVCTRCTDQILGLIDSGELLTFGEAVGTEEELEGDSAAVPSWIPQLKSVRDAWKTAVAIAGARFEALLELPAEERLETVRKDPSLRTVLLWKLLVVAIHPAEEPDDRRALAELALAVADDLDPATPPSIATDCAAASRVVLAWEHLNAGDPSLARFWLTQAELRAERETGDPVLRAQIAFARAACEQAEESPFETIDFLWQALDAASDAGDLELAGDVLVHLGFALEGVGETAAACGALAAGLYLGGGDPETRTHAQALAKQLQDRRRRQQPEADIPERWKWIDE